jgi:hypothetical protein
MAVPRRLTLLAVLVASAVPPQPAEAADTATVQRGGTMVMGMTNDPPTVNPTITAGAPDN